MNNPFKQIETQEKAPEHLKSRVMESVDYAKFFLDVADLFSLKYAQTLADLFRTEEGKNDTTENPDS